MTPTLVRRALGALVGLVVATSAGAALGQGHLREIPPPDVARELASFDIADGLEVNLWAADDLLHKPIQINFDADGRLWAASSAIYPQIQPGAAATDRILVLEDTDGDGAADRSTVFADDLLIPTGIAPGDGGVYVANSTELLHLRDTDGDGKADSRRIVLSGFGTEDTHHIIHTFRWGPDGLLYFNQSIYIHSHVETPWGVRRLNAGGIWRLRPETLELDVFARGMVNGWGHEFDDWGQSFGADGAYHEGTLYFFPGVSYATAYNAQRVFNGLNPGSPKHCGAEILDGRHFPEELRGSFVTCDFRANRIHRFALSDDGSGYAARQMPDLLRSRHVAFRPVDLRMGPDGALYVADWYNPIIQHGEVDFRDPRRNHTNGRIWRISAKGRKALATPRRTGAPIDALLADVAAPERWTRLQAKRTLSELPARDVLAALAAWVGALDAADPRHEHHLLEALWTHQTLNVVDEPLLARVLGSPEPRARAAAVRVLSQWRDRIPDTLERLSRLVADPFPRVRLEAVCALGLLSQPGAIDVALRALDHPMDRFLDHALWQTVNDLRDVWLPALERGEIASAADAAKLEWALTAVGSSQTVPALRKLIEDGKSTAQNEPALLRILAAQGGAGDQLFVLGRIASAPDPAVAPGLLDALSRAAADRDLRVADGLEALRPLLERPDDATRAAALRLAGAWRIEAARERLESVAAAAESSATMRQAAMDGLVSLGDPASARALAAIAAADAPLATRVQATAALAALDLALAAQRAVALFDATAADPARAAVLFRAILGRESGATLLAAALGEREVPADVARVGLRTLQTLRIEHAELAALLAKRAGAETWESRLDDALRAELVREVAASGNAARGEVVFRRPELECLRCHAFGGAGGVIGPDLSSLGGVAQPDYLIDALILPNKAVKENYHAITLVLSTGQVISGIPIRQTDRSVTVRTAEGGEIEVASRSIITRQVTGSIMPAGIVDTLTRAELVDLVRFLAALGKEPGFTVAGPPRVRRWRLLREPPRDIVVYYPERIGALLAAGEGLEWSPAYSTAAGELPLNDVNAVQKWGATVGRFELGVSAAGRIRLGFGDVTGLALWVDGKHVPIPERAEVVDGADAADVHVDIDVAAGRRTIDVLIDLRERRRSVVCELLEAPGSTAQAQLAGGP